MWNKFGVVRDLIFVRVTYVRMYRRNAENTTESLPDRHLTKKFVIIFYQGLLFILTKQIVNFFLYPQYILQYCLLLINAQDKTAVSLATFIFVE